MVQYFGSRFSVAIKSMDSEIGLHGFEYWPLLFICSVICINYLIHVWLHFFIPKILGFPTVCYEKSKKIVVLLMNVRRGKF